MLTVILKGDITHCVLLLHQHVVCFTNFNYCQMGKITVWDMFLEMKYEHCNAKRDLEVHDHSIDIKGNITDAIADL